MSRGEFMLFSKPTPELFQSAAREVRRRRHPLRLVLHGDHQGRAPISITRFAFAKLLGSRNITGDATGDDPEGDRRALHRSEGLTSASTITTSKAEVRLRESGGRPHGVGGPFEDHGRTLDIGHIASCGYDTVDAVRKLAPHLKMVHLKDIQAPGARSTCCSARESRKIPEVMQELQKVNYSGLVAIEYEKEGPVEEDVRIEVEWPESGLRLMMTRRQALVAERERADCGRRQAARGFRSKATSGRTTRRARRSRWRICSMNCSPPRPTPASRTSN